MSVRKIKINRILLHNLHFPVKFREPLEAFDPFGVSDLDIESLSESLTESLSLNSPLSAGVAVIDEALDSSRPDSCVGPWYHQMK